MRLGWALLLGIVGGIAVAWWLSRDTPAQARDKQARAQSAAAATMSRTHDQCSRAGSLHVTATPPKGRPYERIYAETELGIEVHGDR